MTPSVRKQSATSGPASVGAVVIGRNEGERLAACLDSLGTAPLAAVVYVDSGSTDDSVELAEARGAHVVHLDTSRGFTAARARNAGYRALRELAPRTELVQFLDGDCVLEEGWIQAGRDRLATEAILAAVCGRRRERFPDATPYNRLCDLEWDTPIGPAEACGGDALIRMRALVESGGYDDNFIAGEEPELCHRLRQRGWRVERLDAPMTVHDAAITRFGSWWKRMVRSGYAAASNLDRHGVHGVRHMVALVRSALLHAVLLPAGTFASSLAALAFLPWLAPLPWVLLALLYRRQLRRIAAGRVARGADPIHARTYARYTLLAKWAESLGVLRQWYGRALGRPAGLMEYKPKPSDPAPNDPSKARSSAAASTPEVATGGASHEPLAGGRASEPVRVGYLVNQYPKTSHAWMRREIEGVLATGVEIDRYSIRRVDEPLVDPGDVREQTATTILLEQGAVRVALAVLATVCTRPLRFLSALRQAWSIGRNHPRGRAFHLVYLAEACLLLRFLQRRPVGHLHAHFGTNSATVALFTHTLGGPPFSFTFHGPEIFESISPRCLRAKIHAAAFVVAISHHGFSALERWSDPDDWNKLRLIRCGTDERFLAEKETAPPAEQRVVCVARLSPVKGHLVLLDALAKLVEEGFDPQLSLVGDGDFRPAIERRARALGLFERIRWCGWLSGDGVRDEVLASRLMVLPSFDEGLPVVFMESLALHRPVISTYIAGIPELIENDNTGWVVPAGSVDHLVDALREALSLDDESLMRIARNGAEAVRERHDSQKEAARLAALFRGTNAA
ncbi:Alpha-D-kanosaminyltransferase [Planctomycetes bacterium Pla163]|uniref:Alpha-D-kanosaminyltransferase n=1 Tax=Rohdeia mirabilis TaxID=2528008 RepID=A0A518D3H3_9BACT|nr:Alpha-D-kanosaminyltransferase [Planctomycetes bacterium Pla163]